MLLFRCQSFILRGMICSFLDLIVDINICRTTALASPRATLCRNMGWLRAIPRKHAVTATWCVRRIVTRGMYEFPE
jgi:hypothetical protein